MKKIMISLILNLGIFNNLYAMAPQYPLECHCPRTNQTWIIDKAKITLKPSEHASVNHSRSVASGRQEIGQQEMLNARTHQTAEGTSKIVSLNGQQYTWGYSNSLEQHASFFSIKSPKGHEVTYPMDCK